MTEPMRIYTEPSTAVETASYVIYLTVRQPGMPTTEVRMSRELAELIAQQLQDAAERVR